VKMRLYLILSVFAAGLVWLLPVPAADPADVAITVTKDHVDFLAGKNLIGRYHVGANVAKPYFWPLNGPTGTPITRAWPMEKGQPNESADHVHQKSAWLFCHGDVVPEGMELKNKTRGVAGIDFWAEGTGHGRIVCTQVGEPKLSKGHGALTTQNEWRTAADQKVLDETRTVHLYNLGAAQLFVVDIDLHASVVPITFEDTKEGSFGIRINDSIREAKGAGKLENAEGKVGEKNVWGYRSAWCDYAGPLDGKTVGLAILDDPANRYPAYWHSRGYGLMAANPFGREKAGFPGMKGRTDLVKLAKGEHLKLRYGLLIHPGDAKEGKVAEYFQQFVRLKG
jgi:hypothetical protein